MNTEYTPSNQFEYEVIDENNVKIISYTGKDKTIRFPEKIDGRTICEIAPVTFRGCLYVNEVKDVIIDESSKYFTMVDGVVYTKNMEELMFCPKNKQSIIIPDTVKIIRDYAFYKCTELNQVVLPKTIVSIGESAFNGCRSLENFKVPPQVTEIKSLTFCESGLKDISLHNEITSLGKYAFLGCNNLKAITIPNCVKVISESLFDRCSNLENVFIPNEVEKIERDAFSDCRSLKEINLPSSITSIGRGAFSSCKSLKEINIPSGVTSIGSEVFRWCDNLTKVYISDTVTNIGSNIFGECKKLKNSGITVDENNPKFVFKKGDFEIKDTAKMTLEIPNGTTIIKCEKYPNKELISKIVIPESVVEIQERAFSCFPNLEDVIIGKNVKIIGKGAFAYCPKLKSIALPEGLEKIEEQTFSSCKSLSSVAIPTTVKNIEFRAFFGCSLKNISIPNFVEYIGREAFADSIFTKIFLPDSLNKIESSAFSNCKSLKSIQVSENNKVYKSINGNLYSKDGQTLVMYAIGKKEKSFIIPDHVKKIENEAFYECTNLESVTLNDGLEEIGNHAFAFCENIKNNMEIPATVTLIDVGAFWCCHGIPAIYVPKGVKTVKELVFGIYGVIYSGYRSKPKGWAWSQYREEDCNYNYCEMKWGITKEEFYDIVGSNQ